MIRNWRIWSLALAVSLAVHMTVALAFRTDEPTTEVAGGSAVSIAVLGDSFVDEIRAGEEAEQVEAVEPEVMVPQTRPDALSQIELENPLHIDPSADTEIVNAASAETHSHTTVTELLKPSPTDVLTTDKTRQPVTPQYSRVRPKPEAAETAIMSSSPQQAVEAERRVAQQPAELSPKQMALLVPPVPKTRPVAAPKNKSGKSERKREKKRVQAKRKSSSGNEGKSSRNAKRGSASGQRKAKSTRSGQKARTARASGNASITNYRGKLRSRIMRRFRPGRARGARRDVLVAFTVGRNGRIGSVRIARSSGSRSLDAAALRAVRRASPFPPLPSSYGRARLSVTVPMNVRS